MCGLAVAAIDRPLAREKVFEFTADVAEPASDLVGNFGKRVPAIVLATLVVLVVNLFLGLAVVIIPCARLRLRDSNLKSRDGADKNCNKANE